MSSNEVHGASPLSKQAVRLRERQPQDERALLEIAAVVHEQDAYPHQLPDEGLRSFMFAHDRRGAWVATIAGRVVGHVALHTHTSTPVMQLASELTGCTSDQFGVIARLIVDPRHRHQGSGRALLARATGESVDRGLMPILDVVADSDAAIGLYEGCGWRRVGTVNVRFGAGATIQEHVYFPPSVP